MVYILYNILEKYFINTFSFYKNVKFVLFLLLGSKHNA